MKIAKTVICFFIKNVGTEPHWLIQGNNNNRSNCYSSFWVCETTEMKNYSKVIKFKCKYKDLYSFGDNMIIIII